MLRNRLTAKGTHEAVGKEFRGALDACRGEQGDELRRNENGNLRRLWKMAERRSESSTRSWNDISVAHEVRSVQLRPIGKLPVSTQVADVKHRTQFEVVQKAAGDCYNEKGGCPYYGL